MEVVFGAIVDKLTEKQKKAVEMQISNSWFIYSYIGRQVLLCKKLSDEECVFKWVYEDGYILNP